MFTIHYSHQRVCACYHLICIHFVLTVGDSAGVVGSSVDNDYVAAAADVVVEQAEADDDVTIGQRVGMAAGTTLQAASESVDNDIGAGKKTRIRFFQHRFPAFFLSQFYACIPFVSKYHALSVFS